MGDQSLAAVLIDNWLHFTVPSLHQKKRSRSRHQRPLTQSCNEPSTATPETELPCLFRLLQLSTTDGRPDQTLDFRMRNLMPEQKRITTSPEECHTQTPRRYTEATERRSTCDSVERQAKVAIISTNQQPTDSMHQPRRGEAINKPNAVTNYNKYKGGVDLADQHRAYYSVGREHKKW